MSNYDKSHQGSLGTGSLNPRHPKNVWMGPSWSPRPLRQHIPAQGMDHSSLQALRDWDWIWISGRAGRFPRHCLVNSVHPLCVCPAQRGAAGRGPGETPRGAAEGQGLLLPAQSSAFPRKQRCRHPGAHKTRGIPSAEISGNFTRTRITPVCRAQHCLEREQQAFPLEASFLFGAVYGRGAVSHCGTNTLSAFALEDGHSIPLSAAKTRCPAPAPRTVIF